MSDHSVECRLRRASAGIVVLLGAVVLPISLCAGAGDAAKSARVLTLSEVRDGVREFEQRISTLSVVSEAEVDNHFCDANGKAPRKGLIQDDATDLLVRLDSSWLCRSSGRIWQKHTARLTAIQADGSHVDYDENVQANFDGRKGLWNEITRRHSGDSSSVRGIDAPRTYGTFSPLDVTLRYLGKPISQILSQPDAKIVDSATCEGRTVVVVETSVAPKPRGAVEYKTRLWIDPSRGFAVVRRQSWARYSPDRPWRLHFDIVSYGTAEVSSGVWLPSHVEEKLFGIMPVEPKELPLVTHGKIRYRDWKVNPEIPDSGFDLREPIIRGSDHEAAPKSKDPAR
jgi:hypothetical protein